MGTFRLWLAIAVLLWHAPIGFLGRPLWAALAVSGFYILSGFLIQLIIAERFPGTANFYKSRILRLYPLYALVLVASWFWADHSIFDSAMRSGDLTTVAFTLFENVFIFGQELGRFLSFDTATGALGWTWKAPAHWVNGGLPIIGQSWTLALELHFYLLAPFLLRQRTGVLVAIVAVCQAFRFLHPPAYYAPLEALSYYGFPHIELGTFVAGSLSYRLYDRFLRGRHVPQIFGWIVLAALMACGARLDWLKVENYVMFLALIVVAVPVLFAATGRNRIDRFLGELCYPVYLVHLIFIQQFQQLGVPENYVAALTLAASLCVSAPLVLLLEKPIDRYRARFGASAPASTKKPALAEARAD